MGRVGVNAQSLTRLHWQCATDAVYTCLWSYWRRTNSRLLRDPPTQPPI